ncbi:MAG: hypothetical protein ACRDL6_02490 [Solirubrobacterales bacterium]
MDGEGAKRTVSGRAHLVPTGRPALAGLAALALALGTLALVTATDAPAAKKPKGSKKLPDTFGGTTRASPACGTSC